jgi:hypothetical protein
VNSGNVISTILSSYQVTQQQLSREAEIKFLPQKSGISRKKAVPVLSFVFEKLWVTNSARKLKIRTYVFRDIFQFPEKCVGRVN